MKWVKLGFYGTVVGLVFGSIVFTLSIRLPFLVALLLKFAGFSSLKIIASIIIIEFLAVASSTWLCMKLKNNYIILLQSKLNLQQNLDSLNENLVQACGLLAGLNLVFQIHLLFDVV